ncbi:transposase [Sphingomonas olei]
MLAPGTGKTATGRLWVYLRDNRRWRPSDKPVALFRYSPDRKGERPREHLKAFTGFLQADAYAGFERLYDPGRNPVPSRPSPAGRTPGASSTASTRPTRARLRPRGFA